MLGSGADSLPAIQHLPCSPTWLQVTDLNLSRILEDTQHSTTAAGENADEGAAAEGRRTAKTLPHTWSLRVTMSRKSPILPLLFRFSAESALASPRDDAGRPGQQGGRSVGLHSAAACLPLCLGRALAPTLPCPRGPHTELLPTRACADVYSFGVVLWELLSWQVPWSNEPDAWKVSGGGGQMLGKRWWRWRWCEEKADHHAYPQA